MKAEEISRAIGQLDEELIKPVLKEREERHMKKNHHMLWKAIAACAACLALIIGVMTVNLGGNPDNISGGGAGGNTDNIASGGSGGNTGGGLFGADTVYAASLASAHYPETYPYPDEMSCITASGDIDGEKFDSMYNPWSAQQRERYAAGRALRSPDEFYQTTIRQFLADAGDKNRVYSPLNVYMALAMLAETTDGDSRAQILDLLGAQNMEDLRGQAKNLWSANYRNDGATTSILANSLWLNGKLDFKQKTLDTLARDYYTSSFGGDPASREMTADLRAWLNDQTGGLLKDSVDQIELKPETILALCSTVYFRAKWDTQFNKSDNDRKIFHCSDGDVETEFMNATAGYGPYYWNDDFSAISLRFEDGGYMWLILPDEDKTVDDVLARGDYLTMCNHPENWENQKSIKVHYSVPRFDVSSDLQLAEGLKALGITDVFNPARSDFSPLTDTEKLFVSEARHAARVTIDEEGCTAAAFTAMMVSGAGMPPEEEIDFILDRPFLFVISSDTHCPLFTGVVNRP